MPKAVRLGVLLVVVLAACSGGGGSTAASTTTSAAPTSTSEAPTTTLSPEDQVKAAYLAYWQMADRLGRKPDPMDPELPQRTEDPLLSMIRDGLTTQAAQGRTFVINEGRPNEHRLGHVQVNRTSATLADCFVDGRSELDGNGVVIDDAIVSKSG